MRSPVGAELLDDIAASGDVRQRHRHRIVGVPSRQAVAFHSVTSITTMSQLKLTYFNFHGGRGEPTRLALHMGGVAFEDHRFGFADFPEIRKSAPLGQVPVLEVDGVRVTQSDAITRYAGKLAGLYPTDALQALLCDEVMQAVEAANVHVGAGFGLTGDAWYEARTNLVEGPLPILAAAWSASTNTDAFTGRKIVQDDMGVIESTGERLKNIAGDILPPLTPGVGVHAATLSNAGRRTGSLDMRNKYQSWIRAVLGMDVRSADPDLRKETAFFRKQNNLPVEGNTNTYTTPLKSRLAADIRGELIQDEPALDKIAEAMSRLEASGNPIRTPKQMTDLLDNLDPTKLIKKKFRTRLIASFSPEAKRVFDNRQTEFKKSQAKAPGILAEIRRQKAAGNE